ncbi:hypothetical protein ACNPQM_35970 [Streptomyces sp. NPDC056231]|uniref:hypothetical protein n=1 Tax=Streptomyces sp. NPDC056231 TaxID=3345755 RepID=UPI003AAED330
MADSSNSNGPRALLTRIRVWLILFVVCLVLSGVTAFPLVTELRRQMACSPTSLKVTIRWLLPDCAVHLKTLDGGLMWRNCWKQPH